MGKQLTLAEIDRNMAIESKINEPDVCFYDVREAPFEVYGLYNYKNEELFKRLPDEIGKNVNPGVAELYLNTAGGRVRFSSDSLYVGIRAVIPETGISRFHRAFRMDVNIKDGYEAILKFKERKLRHFTIHFPSYSNVRTLLVVLHQDATLGEGNLPGHYGVVASALASAMVDRGCIGIYPAHVVG